MKQLKSATCSACRQSGGADNGNWRGGRSKHKAGYLMVWKPDHPRARTGVGYVFEHILVMEDLLGRYLLPDETVHHRNGIKDDNRSQNLELWVRPQPSGIGCGTRSRGHAKSSGGTESWRHPQQHSGAKTERSWTWLDDV